jgi:integrase
VASIYSRKDSPNLWIKFKNESGKWVAMNTGFRRDNPGDRKQASNLARTTSLKEMATKTSKASGSEWQDWVIPWINSRWGDVQKPETSAHVYGRYFYRWLKYFEERKITTPQLFKREHTDDYLAWRTQQGAGRNSAIGELKFLAQVLDEAIARNFVSGVNVCRKLRIRADKPADKIPWSDEEVSMVQTELEKNHLYDWMHVSFLLGLHQAARLRMCAIPLSVIDFDKRIINYPGTVMKGGKSFSQPIAPEFIDVLRSVVEHRRKLKKSTLAEIPDPYKHQEPAGVQWRKLLDSLGLHNLSHHGLRVRWITQAALLGVHESMAMKFANHRGLAVHRIYQKIQNDDVATMLDGLLLARSKALTPLLPPK